MTQEQEITSRFKIVCRKCGSENVMVNISESWGGTDVTAGNGGALQIGCNDCKDNDVYIDI